ncbi:MAG TPA: methyltransferase domain-containing protein [Pseudonocardiaceae bacterium]|nr:methyltransferase domain-containing protein [Pseudonocardiaceae bacterium]
MLVTSRSAQEYRAMFDLTEAECVGRAVLDCCAGGASFVAECGAVAVDPAYAEGAVALAEQVRAGLRDGGRMIDDHSESFDWSWYGRPERRAELRTAAALRFLHDLRLRPGRYVAGALPELPFADRSFDLVLCSHLLFSWSNVLDEKWHLAALRELVRVTRGQVRVFPLVVQGTGAAVPFLGTLRAALAADGLRTRLALVPYRFQRGAGEMLVVEREQVVANAEP